MEKKQKRAALYIRVSTTEQNMDGQEVELREYAAARGWEVARVYKDKISGTKDCRPGLNALMCDVGKRRVDIVLVWKFDRFARSVSHLLNALETFRSVGVEFASISEQIDTLSPAGKLVFTILGAVSELERSLIAERVRMGLLQARRKGVRLGRPPLRTLSSSELEKVRRDRATGKLSLRALAHRHGISVWAAQQAVSGLDLAA